MLQAGYPISNPLVGVKQHQRDLSNRSAKRFNRFTMREENGMESQLQL